MIYDSINSKRVEDLEKAENEIKLASSASKGKVPPQIAKELGKRLGSAMDIHNAVVQSNKGKRFDDDMESVSKQYCSIAGIPFFRNLESSKFDKNVESSIGTRRG